MNILLTSISAKINLVKMFKDAAQPMGLGVYGCDCDADVLARKFVDGFLLVKPTVETNYVGDLIAQCKSNDINLVIPTRDGDIAMLARYHNDFMNAGVKLLVPDIDMVQICQNKSFFNDWLIRTGYSALQKFDVDNVSETEFPLFVRPLLGGGAGEGAGIVRHPDDVTNPDDVILTNFVEAVEYSIDLLMDLQSRPLQAVVRSRDKIVDGEAKISTVVHFQELEDAALGIGSDLRLVGHNVLQAFKMPDGEIIFFDVNTRYGGSSDLSVKAGLNSPSRILNMVYGSLKDKKEAKKICAITFGLQLNRGMEEPFTMIENSVAS